MPTLKNKNKSKIIAVDFDGTLCKFDFPNIGKQLKKHKELLDILIDLRKKGHKLILWTNRGDNEKYPVLSQAVKWCSDKGLEFDAINENLKKANIYSSYAINFRPPADRKPTSQEIRRYSTFLKKHISIINPKIIILFGSTAMEAVTASNERISNERGKWKEIILENKTYPLMITFSPSYLIRFPENKKYAWEDLKLIKQKIIDLKIKT